MKTNLNYIENESFLTGFIITIFIVIIVLCVVVLIRDFKRGIK